MLTEEEKDTKSPDQVQKSYICHVPDNCDRIIWRHNYYALPIEYPTNSSEE